MAKTIGNMILATMSILLDLKKVTCSLMIVMLFKTHQRWVQWVVVVVVMMMMT